MKPEKNKFDKRLPIENKAIIMSECDQRVFFNAIMFPPTASKKLIAASNRHKNLPDEAHS